jgi:protein gp37
VAENSHISWTNHTFNPWIGCTKVSPACDGCYAAHLMGGGRYSRVVWGEPGKGEGTRSRTAPSNWAKVRKWNKQASDAPGKTYVFCASLADVFDNAVPTEWRRDLFELIRETPNLTWLLLTKRPGNIVKLYDEAMARAEWCGGPFPRNAAIGCTVVTQEEADRDVPKLLAAKAALNPAFAFLSMEPLLGPVDLWPMLGPHMHKGEDREPVDWVIVGGETDQGAHKARVSDPAWFRSLRDQCRAAGVPFHFKQWGEWQPALDGTMRRYGKHADLCTLDGVAHRARPT